LGYITVRRIRNDEAAAFEHAFRAVFRPYPGANAGRWQIDTDGRTFVDESWRRGLIAGAERPIWYDFDKPGHLVYADALVGAARATGDSEAYRLGTEASADGPLSESNACVYTLTSDGADFLAQTRDGERSDNDLHVISVLENAVFSPAARWGVAFSQDGYATVGGTTAFMTELERRLPRPLDEELNDYLGNMARTKISQGLPRRYVREQVEYLVGVDRAMLVLDRFGLSEERG
jgi:hypothetical protein